jgi:uncharacterized delta-60 repeat protein
MAGSRIGRAILVVATLLVAPATALAQVLDNYWAAVAPGSVQAMAVQADGKLIVGGTFSSAGWGCGPTTCPITRSNLACFNADGSLDHGFNPGTNGEVFSVAVLPDGKILVAGFFTTIGGGGSGATPRRGFARLNADGSVDPTFDPVPAAAPFPAIRAILPRADGSVILGGVTQLKTSTGTVTLQQIGRLQADGFADPAFTPGVGNGAIETLAIDQQGRLLAGGSFRLAGSGGVVATTRERIARFLANGTLDPDFNPGVANPGGASSSVEAIAVQPNGSILVGGPFRLIGGGTGTQSRNYIARLDDTGAVEAFDAALDVGSGSNSVRSIALQADGRILIAGYWGASSASASRASTRRARSTARSPR